MFVSHANANNTNPIEASNTNNTDPMEANVYSLLWEEENEAVPNQRYHLMEC